MANPKGKGHGMAGRAILFAMVIGITCFCGSCSLGTDGNSQSKEKTGQARDESTKQASGWAGVPQTVQMESLMDYAKKLEAAGNQEAAAAVYELIAQSGGEMIQKLYEENPVVSSAEELNQWNEVLRGGKGGKR